MSCDQDLRWVNRFLNFEKTHFLLKEALQKESLNELERDGLVYRFELTIEFCWRLLKDYLQEQGCLFSSSSREIIRQACLAGYVKDTQALLNGLTIRNELLQDYSGEKFERAEPELRGRVFVEIDQVYSYFKSLVTGQTKLCDE